MSEALESKHTSTFPAFLKQLGISLVVSTYQAGKLILLRNDKGVLNTHFLAMERPMGIAANAQRITVGVSSQVLDYYNIPAVAPNIEPVGTHDACYMPRRTHVTGDIDIHEMAYAANNKLWFVNTRMSCLCTLDIKHSVVPQWRPPFISQYDLTDRCHLNGLAMKNAKPGYITALGRSDTPGGWRENKANGGILMQLNPERLIAHDLSMPHSPRWYKDKLWVLESGAGTLAIVDQKKGKREVVAELPGFTRGLDFIGDYAIIGLSQVRETAVFAGLPLTQRCEERQCGVWVVDIRNGQTVAYVTFSGDVDEIFAVHALPSRFPVILEQGHALLRNSYSLPDAALEQFAEKDPIQIELEHATQKHQSGKLDEAIVLYRALLEKLPHHELARYQLGVALSDAEHWQEAIEVLERLVKEHPEHALAQNSLGHAYAGIEDWENALKHYDAAILSDQTYAVAHFNRGLTLLRLGRYKEGWEASEWRWKTPNFTPFQCPQPQWQGEPIEDKTLLVHTEQGNGDAIQFARFFPLAAQRCKKLIVVCPEQLRLLFKELPDVDEVRTPGNLPTDSFDVYCPIMSLPKALDITLENLPAEVPYIKGPKQVTATLPGQIQQLKVGLVWAGVATHKQDHHRSCPLKHIVELCCIDGIEFYSLQIPVKEEERKILAQHNITDLESELVSYAHTAALIEQMDLVISVDTSVVHVAGALNKPVWVLNAKKADWRWGLNGTDNAWYPSARLFCQTKVGDWKPVLENVRTALTELVSAKLS